MKRLYSSLFLHVVIFIWLAISLHSACSVCLQPDRFIQRCHNDDFGHSSSFRCSVVSLYLTLRLSLFACVCFCGSVCICVFPSAPMGYNFCCASLGARPIYLRASIRKHGTTTPLSSRGDGGRESEGARLLKRHNPLNIRPVSSRSESCNTSFQPKKHFTLFCSDAQIMNIGQARKQPLTFTAGSYFVRSYK